MLRFAGILPSAKTAKQLKTAKEKEARVKGERKRDVKGEEGKEDGEQGGNKAKLIRLTAEQV